MGVFYPMKRFLPFLLSVVTCICLLAATERRALAYVDPGSGLLALQSLGSIAAAAAYFMRRRILALFGKGPQPASKTQAPQKSTSVNMPVALRKEDSRNAA
jgi:hypothetical protein